MSPADLLVTRPYSALPAVLVVLLVVALAVREIRLRSGADPYDPLAQRLDLAVWVLVPAAGVLLGLRLLLVLA